MKWNRTFNVSGLPGRNIPLDLQKEHDNKDIKCLWRNLGANLDEHNAERTEGTLESRQLIYQSIDRDCVVNVDHFARKIPKEEEAVNLITGDQLINDVFKKTPACEGYAFFSKFRVSYMDLITGICISGLRSILPCGALYTNRKNKSFAPSLTR